MRLGSLFKSLPRLSRTSEDLDLASRLWRADRDLKPGPAVLCEVAWLRPAELAAVVAVRADPDAVE